MTRSAVRLLRVLVNVGLNGIDRVRRTSALRARLMHVILGIVIIRCSAFPPIVVIKILLVVRLRSNVRILLVVSRTLNLAITRSFTLSVVVVIESCGLLRLLP